MQQQELWSKPYKAANGTSIRRKLRTKSGGVVVVEIYDTHSWDPRTRVDWDGEDVDGISDKEVFDFIYGSTDST